VNRSPEDSYSSDNYTEQSSGDQDGWEDETPLVVESQRQNQSVTELTPFEIGSSELDDNPYYSEHDHDNVQLRFPSPPWSQNVHPLGNEDLISMATTNLGETEYEELQRIYRERVW
jgi:hypothetical protein